MSRTESETRHVKEDEEFRQGDVVRIFGRSSPPYLGVVINADCDLANKKTDGVISFLPVYTLREYLRDFWLSDFLEGQRQQILGDILSTCDYGSEELPWLIEWLDSEDSDAVIQKLSDNPSLHKKSKTKISDSVSLYDRVFKSERELEKQFSMLCSTKKDSDIYATRQIQGAYRQMGEGHLFLNEITGVDNIGFVVRMRRIYSIQSRYFFRSDRDYKIHSEDGDICAVRFSKLTDIFQFKLAQLFAYQFSRVGLPDVFKDMHPTVLEAAASELMEVGK